VRYIACGKICRRYFLTVTITAEIAYPIHLERDVVLRTGRTLRIRPIRPSDHDALRRFFDGLSAESLHARFFDSRRITDRFIDGMANIDYVLDFGVVGEIGGEIVAVAHYFASRRTPHVAEVAFTIADELHGRGVGTHLLQTLAAVARTHQIDTFEAEVLTENEKMIDVFRCSGFDVGMRSDGGTIHVRFPTEETLAYDEVSAGRSQHAAYASLKPVFEPRSIAVIGAGRQPGQLGHEIVHNLRATGYTGKLYAINPTAAEIDSVRAYPSLAAVDDEIDLAIVVVPQLQVERVVDDCVAKGVRALVVITAGFGELGEEGRAAEQRLVDKIRSTGMRMVGPNCMGVINTDPSVRMHATFSPVFPPAGNVAMSSQSGALGLAILDYARSLGIGFSTFISVGNKADVSGNDLIQYWAEDPHTDVMLLYLESFGNPRKFGEIARRVGKKKPIIAVKAGRSNAGKRAASSHTGALATSDALVGDLFRQAGIIRTDTLEELFDAASLLASQPLPRGRNVAIVTNAGGPGILAADACEANGLEIPLLGEETASRLRGFLPPAASVRNPVDMIATAKADQYKQAIDILLHDDAIDAVLAIYIPVLATDAAGVANAIRESSLNANGKTILATFMSAQGLPSSLSPVPAFAFPERAVKALARAADYAEWRQKPVGIRPRFDDINVETLRAAIDRQLQRGGGWLEPLDVIEILGLAGIEFVDTSFVTSAEAAVEAAICFEFPVVLKAYGPTLLHKTDAGGVRLSLQNEAAVHDAFAELKDRLGDAMTGAVVQRMVSGGVEVMAGAIEEPTFGHAIAYGAGGVLVDLLSDVAFRIQPLTEGDADDLVNEVRCTRLLRGFRGAPPIDEQPLREVLLRLSALVDACPEIREIDINPLKVTSEGAIAVDARVRVERIVLAPPSRRVAY
jgi:acetyl coenzyme A synthetase (ADP forming)-like protein